MYIHCSDTKFTHPHHYLLSFLPLSLSLSLSHSHSIELCSVRSELSSDLCSDAAVNHALMLSSAWYMSNYHRFFELYRQTPNHGRDLVDLFIDRERKAALKTIAKAWVTCNYYCIPVGMLWGCAVCPMWFGREGGVKRILF